jgi:stage II sporulation protein P
MNRHLRRGVRGGFSLALAASALWAVTVAAPLDNLEQAARSVGSEAMALALLRFERGDGLSALSLPAALALNVTPLLLAAPDTEAEPTAEEAPAEAPPPDVPADETPAEPAPLTVRDNGVPATTLRPSDAAGYLSVGSVLVHNTGAAALSQSDLRTDGFATLPEEAPQVLILHTHGCEAYTMPPGEAYEASDDHRTLDERYNVLRVGDEIAQVLENAGIGVIHDRTLHDYPNYSGSYNRSLATAERWRSEHPSLVYVLDVHRDAVADGDGNQYKLLCAEEPSAAQMEFVLGSDGGGLSHDRWRENLRLACAVQETLLSRYPTLMRPIIVRNSRYNQQISTGALLLEVGTAGNSLEEALVAARLFAQGFADTIKGQPSG